MIRAYIFLLMLFASEMVSAQGLSVTTPEFDPETLPPVGVDSIQPWLANIPLKTRQRGISADESDLFYRLISFARDADRKEVAASAQTFLRNRHADSKFADRSFKDFPVYVDLYLRPELYQGHPVTLTGHLQRTVVTKAAENELGVDQLCEAWLFTDDSQANPTVLISSQFPDEFPIGEQVIDHVTVTGYFYRMYTYDARDTGRFAPMIIVNQLSWNPTHQVGGTGSPWGTIISAVVVLIVISFVVAKLILWKTATSDQEQRTATSTLMNQEQPDFSAVLQQDKE